MNISSKVWTIGGVILLLAAITLTIWRVWPSNEQVGNNATHPEQTKPKLDATISGQLVVPQIAERRPMAVMVENHPDARPQSGLSQAEVVYEMVAEGGITRYVAVFQQDAGAIGPVRSARDYFAELADSWSAVYAHVGGSPEALEQIKNGMYKNLTDINEFYQGSYFTRIKTRIAPHNTYISTEKLMEYESTNKKDTPLNPPHSFTFTDALPSPTQPATAVTIDFSLPSYKALFTYDPATQKYLRSVAGKADTDAVTKTQLAPKTVIVQETDINPIPGDDKFRVNLRTTGTGKAYIFQNGGVTIAAWKREPGKLTQYLDAQSSPISFTPGQFWIALVSKDSPTAITWK